MKPHVLVVEDEEDLRSIVEYNLRLAGYETEGVGTAWAALQSVARSRPSLVILDLMLPDFPGTQVCRELKERADTRDVPVLMLTAKGEEVARVTGLEIGADDYVVKPVSMKELVLRVGAILRRSAAQVGGPSAARSSSSAAGVAGVTSPAGGAVASSGAALLGVRPGEPEVVEVAGLRIDFPAHVVTFEGARIDLTPLEFRLLATLIERAGRVQTREALLEDVWQIRGDLTTRTVDTHVKRLRAKLGAAGEKIETVRGLGYRFNRNGGDAA